MLKEFADEGESLSQGICDTCWNDSNEYFEEFTNLPLWLCCIYGNIYAGEVLSGLLLTLSQQAAGWYPIAFVSNLIWTAFRSLFHVFKHMYFTMLTSMYLGKKINSEENRGEIRDEYYF